MNFQTRIAYVTGVSGGIGKAVALHLLTKGYSVFGIGRTNTINQSDYQFLSLDLKKCEDVSLFQFPHHPAQSYLLINNAGMLGDILPVGDLNPENISAVMHVNAIAPQILTNTFIQTFSRKNAHLHVINISSGAGRKPIDAWSTYCASKAALDLFSETLKLEMELRNANNFFIHSVAPGVVDTNMQGHIRKASPEKFKSSQRFHDLKNNNQLLTPVFVAEKLFQLVTSPQTYPKTILSLSDI
jgi:benzil reductase ((S)-benzoin forming)